MFIYPRFDSFKGLSIRLYRNITIPPRTSRTMVNEIQSDVIEDSFVPKVGALTGEFVRMFQRQSSFHQEQHRGGSFWYTGRICRNYEGLPPGVGLKFANLDHIFSENIMIWTTCPHATAIACALLRFTWPSFTKSLLMLQIALR